MRRLLLAATLGLATAAALAPAAGASQLVTWETPSGYVKPDEILANKPPPGGPELPLASPAE